MEDAPKGSASKPTAPGLCRRRRHAHFAAELVGRAGLALADALDLGGVQRVDLRSALLVVLDQHALGDGQQRHQALLRGGIAGDPAIDVADDAAEPAARQAQLASGALELAGMDVAPGHDRGSPGEAQITLTQLHP